MNKLKELRLLKKLSQAQVASHLGITSQAYGNYEGSRREPDNATACKLADLFDVSLDYLLGRTDIRTIAIPDNLNDVQIAFAGGLDGLTQEDLDDVSEYIKFIKSRKNKD